MSAAHWTVVSCDVAGCDARYTVNGGQVAATFAEARARAREAGWLIQPRIDGDLCPNHRTWRRVTGDGGDGSGQTLPPIDATDSVVERVAEVAA